AEERADPAPEGEAAAVAAQRRRDLDPPPAAAREEVDRRDDERQQGGDEDDLERPAANEPLAEVEVAGGPLREGDALLHRGDRVLRRSSDLAEARHVETLARGSLAARRPISGGGDRHRGDAAADERRLLVGAEREAEVDQLPQPARPRRVGA